MVREMLTMTCFFFQAALLWLPCGWGSTAEWGWLVDPLQNTAELPLFAWHKPTRRNTGSLLRNIAESHCIWRHRKNWWIMLSHCGQFVKHQNLNDILKQKKKHSMWNVETEKCFPFFTSEAKSWDRDNNWLKKLYHAKTKYLVENLTTKSGSMIGDKKSIPQTVMHWKQTQFCRKSLQTLHSHKQVESIPCKGK